MMFTRYEKPVTDVVVQKPTEKNYIYSISTCVPMYS